jgi:hypothetical protein
MINAAPVFLTREGILIIRSLGFSRATKYSSVCKTQRGIACNFRHQRKLPYFHSIPRRLARPILNPEIEINSPDMFIRKVTQNYTVSEYLQSPTGEHCHLFTCGCWESMRVDPSSISSLLRFLPFLITSETLTFGLSRVDFVESLKALAVFFNLSCDLIREKKVQRGELF